MVCSPCYLVQLFRICWGQTSLFPPLYSLFRPLASVWRQLHHSPLLPGCWQVLSPNRKETNYSDQTRTYASLLYNAPTMFSAGGRPATSWVHCTTSCNTQSSAPEDGQNNCTKHVGLIGIINKPLLLHLVGCQYYLFRKLFLTQIFSLCLNFLRKKEL